MSKNIALISLSVEEPARLVVDGVAAAFSSTLTLRVPYAETAVRVATLRVIDSGAPERTLSLVLGPRHSMLWRTE